MDKDSAQFIRRYNDFYKPKFDMMSDKEHTTYKAGEIVWCIRYPMFEIDSCPVAFQKEIIEVDGDKIVFKRSDLDATYKVTVDTVHPSKEGADREITKYILNKLTPLERKHIKNFIDMI